MPEFEFDVDASIAAGWERFAARLAELLRDLVPGTTFDLSVPLPGSGTAVLPYIRFTADSSVDTASVVPGASEISLTAEIIGEGPEGNPTPLRPSQYNQLAGLGWDLPPINNGEIHPRLRTPAFEASHLAHLVAGTIERVFGIPHPVFLHDVAEILEPRSEPDGADTSTTPTADAKDFRSQPIHDPDQATRALAVALSEVYGDRIEADEHDVFTVPAGCVVLLVRAHRSLPLIVFRSPLIQEVEDAAAAEIEVAILNRDSLWCRYIFDGKAVYAESEFVDRVFVPVNFKIQLAEIAAELDDVYPDLARRVAAEQWRDLHSADEPRFGEQ